MLRGWGRISCCGVFTETYLLWKVLTDPLLVVPRVHENDINADGWFINAHTLLYSNTTHSWADGRSIEGRRDIFSNQF